MGGRHIIHTPADMRPGTIGTGGHGSRSVVTVALTARRPEGEP